MDMNKLVKKLSLCLVSASVGAVALACAACSSSLEPQFLEGIDTEIELGDAVVLTDYIDYVTDGKYTITASLGSYSEDITTKRGWRPQEPGTYTITYTVHSGAHIVWYWHITLLGICSAIVWSIYLYAGSFRHIVSVEGLAYIFRCFGTEFGEISTRYGREQYSVAYWISRGVTVDYSGNVSFA